jgi:proteasome lid subunit RPN8/RPN11
MTNQTDIFSMFGIEDEYAEEKKRQEEARKKQMEEAAKRAEERKKAGATSTSGTASSITKKEELFDLNMDTFICHLGQEIPITDYFSTEEIENGLPSKKKGEEEVTYKKIEGNEVRKRLEKTFPDLVAAYTEMVYIKNKNMIMAVPKAKRKGLFQEVKESSDSLAPSFNPIPFSILSDFICLSKEYSNQFGVELYGDVYYDLTQQEFFMDIPHQLATPLTVERIEDAYVTAMKLQDKKFIKVMEIHSHHKMLAKPSRLDNESERQENILYVIIGRVDNFFPDITVRIFNKKADKHFDINPYKVFESPFYLMSKDYDTSNVEVYEQ